MRQVLARIALVLILLLSPATAAAQVGAPAAAVRGSPPVHTDIALTRLDSVPAAALRAGALVLPDSGGGWRVVLAFDNPCEFSLVGHLRAHRDTLVLDVLGRPRVANCPAKYRPEAFVARLGPMEFAHVLVILYWDRDQAWPARQPVDLPPERPGAK